MHTQTHRWFLIVTLLLWTQFSLAAIPDKLDYQGYLTDPAGAPVSGEVDMTLSLYATSTGGSLLWTETQTGVVVKQGLFGVEIGAITVLPASLFDIPLYLGIAVESDSEMVPRKLLGSFPTASRSELAEAVKLGGVTEIMIKNNTVSPAEFMRMCNDGEIIVKTATAWICGAAP